MISYLLLCRSLTYAQRTARVLERAGIGARLARTPKAVAKEGCGYCVHIREQHLSRALRLLHQEGLGPKQVYLQTGEDSYSEVGP